MSTSADYCSHNVAYCMLLIVCNREDLPLLMTANDKLWEKMIF